VAPFPTAYRYGWDQQTATRFALSELDFLLQTQTAPRETAAFVVEPVLGEGGYVPADPAFLHGLRERADRHGILLVLDEIQTGFGRTGEYWGHDHAGVRPDIVTIAKGLASGFPLSAIAAPQQLMGRAFPGSQGGTYGGNAVACAAAVATLDVIRDEKLVENAAAMGRRLSAGLEQVARENAAIGDVRGLGLMQASEFVTAEGSPDPVAAARVQQAAAAEGMLLLLCGPWNNVVRMIPALVVDDAAIDEGLRAWARAVQAGTAA
jgi:4-aminobutyrate aminotransferase